MPLSLFISEAKSKEMDRLMERRNAYEEASAEKGKLRTNRSDYSLCSLSNELVAQCCISTGQPPVFRHFNSVVLNKCHTKVPKFETLFLCQLLVRQVFVASRRK